MSTPNLIPVLGNLSELEQRVVDAARRGGLVVCGDLGPAELAVTGDPRYLVRAELVRELLLGRHGDLDPRGIRISFARIVGALDLDHVVATGGLTLTDCAFTEVITANTARLPHVILDRSALPGLHAQGLHTDGDLRMQGVVVRGASDTGAISLISAHIGDQADFEETTISNTDGPAVDADGARIDGILFMRNATLRGVGEAGAVRLPNVRIGNQADFAGSSITCDGGAALIADGLRTGGIVFLQRSTIRGNDAAGSLLLPGAVIGGPMYCGELTVSNEAGPAVDLREARVDQTVELPPTVICGHPDRADCRTGGLIQLDRFAFTTLGAVPWQQWLHLIRWHTPEYRPQPYQQLAAVERAAGHENNARLILIAQQDDLRRRNPQAVGGRAARWAHKLWGWLGGYGYRIRNTALALMGAFLLVGALGFWAGHWVSTPGHHAIERTNGSGTPCSTLEQIGVGIDRGLPLAPAGIRSKCDLDTTTTAGQWFTAAIWFLQACVWILATLAVAGYTGLIRKPA